MRDLLSDRIAQAERLEPRGRGGARGGRALADLVAVDEERRGPGPRKLTRHRQAGKTGTADEHIHGCPVERMTFGSSSRGTHGHATLRGLTAALVIASLRGRWDHVYADP
jgi:hypothetical protein